MTTIKYHFDVISPYAWLGYKGLKQRIEGTNLLIDPVPTLFAGLLNKHGQLGPAEIPPKRIWV